MDKRQCCHFILNNVIKRYHNTATSVKCCSIPSESKSTGHNNISNINNNENNNIIEKITTFHKRPLPQSLIGLSSLQGKVLFKEALNLGGMESFFPLSEQFITQSEPSFCALSSLAMVLNALNHDPKKVWKGSWRWVSEETLQCETALICGHSLDKVRSDGMNFNEFESLARCHGVSIKSYQLVANRSLSINLDSFRSLIIDSVSSDTAANFIVVNFCRQYLGQTGGGHFSPIGGYHREKDLLLILDVARFKYP
jgi:glutathione gamma-glutamylcysteinyltransferase